jgi:hypothetical protein
MAESSDLDELPELPSFPTAQSTNRPNPTQLQTLSSELSELSITPASPSEVFPVSQAPGGPSTSPGPGDDDDDDAAEPGDDIVTETVKTWNVCRTRNRRRASRGQDRPQAYNLEAFVVKWVESDNRARQLGYILMDDCVREALRAQGISIRYMADDVEDPAIKIRREMKTLLKEPQFADFIPHHGLAPAPATASAPAPVTVPVPVPVRVPASAPAPAQEQAQEQAREQAPAQAPEDDPLPRATIAELCDVS